MCEGRNLNSSPWMEFNVTVLYGAFCRIIGLGRYQVTPETNLSYRTYTFCVSVITSDDNAVTRRNEREYSIPTGEY